MLVRRAFFNEIVILSLWVIILVKNGNAMATFPRGISHSGVLYAINDPLKHPIVDTWMKMNEEKLQKEKLVMDMLRQMYNLLQLEMTNAIDIGRKSNRFTRNHPAVTNAKRAEIFLNTPKLFNYLIRL